MRSPPSYPAPGTAQDWRSSASGGLDAPPDPPGAFHQFLNSMGSAVGGLGMRGIGLLLNRFGGGPSATISPGGIPYGRVPAGMGSGVTRSAGGWNVDANGNLIGDTAGVQYPNRTSFEHTTRMPGYASNFSSAVRSRNII